MGYMTDDEYRRMVETCSEVELYLTIDYLGGFVWRMNHDMAHQGRIPNSEHAAIRKDVAAQRKRIDVAVDQCPRFGVETPRVERTDAITEKTFLGASDAYWLWFCWWDAWSKALSDEQFNKLDADMTEKRDLSKWRPEGNWNATSEELPPSNRPA